MQRKRILTMALILVLAAVFIGDPLLQCAVPFRAIVVHLAHGIEDRVGRAGPVLLIDRRHDRLERLTADDLAVADELQLRKPQDMDLVLRRHKEGELLRLVVQP